MDFFDRILDQLIPQPAPTPNLGDTPAARTEMEPIVINSQNDGDSDDCKEVTVGDGYIRNRASRTRVRNGNRDGATQDGEVIMINDTSPDAPNRRRSKRSITTLPRHQSGYPSVPSGGTSGGPSRRGNVVDDSSDVEIIEPESVPSSSRPSEPQRAPKRPRPAFLFADVVEMPSPGFRQRKQRAAAPQPTAFQEPGSSGRDNSGSSPRAEMKCVVCLDPMEAPWSTPCGHLFCRPCITKSIQSFKKCPTCRKSCKVSQIHQIFIP